ncbi:hypothetical protein ACQ5SO_08205 [Rhodovulum sp. DZ06]|uniref:hypothetical protein n=1 Tax=Rhodovulum sp. DZ06 TaxID=3425126 RepID=UPI003D3541DC
MQKTAKISLRLSSEVVDALSAQAEAKGFGMTEHVQRLLERRAAKSGHMAPDHAAAIRLRWDVVEKMQALARKLDAKGRFDAHFTLSVFRAAMEDEALRARYEEAIGGDAYGAEAPGRSPLNMNLGSAIRRAVGAEPMRGPGGAPLRAQVRGEPIQTYQLLVKPA